MRSLWQSSVFRNDFDYRDVGGCMFTMSKEFIPTKNISLINNHFFKILKLHSSLKLVFTDKEKKEKTLFIYDQRTKSLIKAELFGWVECNMNPISTADG